MVHSEIMKPKKNKYPVGPELTALAESAPRRIRSKDFLPAVDKLREKGYSWRACAEWLDKNAGIVVSHTSLMRISEDRDGLERLEDEEG